MKTTALLLTQAIHLPLLTCQAQDIDTPETTATVAPSTNSATSTTPRSPVYIDVYDCEQLGTAAYGENVQFCFWTGDLANDPLNAQYKTPLLAEYYDGSSSSGGGGGGGGGNTVSTTVDASEMNEPEEGMDAMERTGINIADPTAVGAYRNVATILDFLWSEWSRDSWNGSGGAVSAAIHLGPSSGSDPPALNDASNQANVASMYFPPQFGFGATNLMMFGNTESGISWSEALDAVSHEFGHGLYWASALNYYPYSPFGFGAGSDDEWDPNMVDEPKSVEEHWCDVLAALVDKYAGKDDAEVFAIFEDLYPVGSPLRLMSNPASTGDTDWYPERRIRPEEEVPDYATNFNGYIYQTAGVPNLAFYLLSEGGVHPNATKASWTNTTVPGIGIFKAGKIWYEAMVGCLFVGARMPHLKYCTELLAGEKFRDSVAMAWEAVGVTEGEAPPAGIADPANFTDLPTASSDSNTAAPTATATATAPTLAPAVASASSPSVGSDTDTGVDNTTKLTEEIADLIDASASSGNNAAAANNFTRFLRMTVLFVAAAFFA